MLLIGGCTWDKANGLHTGLRGACVVLVVAVMMVVTGVRAPVAL